MIRSQVLSGSGFFVFICVLMCCALLEMLGRGWWIPESGNGLFFWCCYVLLSSPLHSQHFNQTRFSLRLSQVRFSTRYTSTTPSTSLWRTAHHILVAAPLMSKGNSRSGEVRCCVCLGSQRALVQLCVGSSSSYHDSEALNEICLL